MKWADIPIPGGYQINENGVVRRKLKVIDGKIVRNIKRTPTQHPKTKLFYYAFYFNGRQQNFYAHEMVAYYHIPNPENCKHVLFINGDRSDYSVKNLKWSHKRK